MVREAVKDIALLADLPPGGFSSHSLRKGGLTQMRGLGTSVDDRKDRGNYAEGSTVFDTIYDNSAVRLGPLACNVNLGMGCVVKQTVEHVGHCSPRRQRGSSFGWSGSKVVPGWLPEAPPLGMS